MSGRTVRRTAGRWNGSPTLGSFGPGFVLARELHEHGDPADRETVIALLDDCAVFWANPQNETEHLIRDLNTRKRADIATWKEMIRAGRIPDFPKSR